jgi:ankyrin repeat protein
MFNFEETINDIYHNKNIELTKELLININAQDESKMTLLGYSVNSGNNFFTKKLLENNANPNLPDDIGNIPLIEASLFGYLDIVKILIRYKSLINYQNNDGETALSSAVSNGHISIVKLLIENGANINLIDKFGTTPLEWALVHNDKDIINHLKSITYIT